ncbi:SET domain-containing protein [Mycena maculata]|uniref:SET domain-containing protein n=1 Tax=Mycena maculata TaxID=230809 RepID=A0AAD7KD48_9AGAR|nr:SET domain-containing protein [Mycena maculata]
MSFQDDVELAPAVSGRSKAVSTRHLSAGSLIVSCEALGTVLIPEEKGKRCDTCHRNPPQLQKCSGCASYFYCSATCQALQWQSHHKKICKRFNQYTASVNFQALAAHEKMDALLLSHLVAQLDSTADVGERVMDLLHGPVDPPALPIVYASRRVAGSLVRDLYSRFGNNNFVIHSHLTTLGHGIFPIASRLFNHSCLPNAAAKYILSPSSPPTMQVVALRDIPPGEEICLPYLDPALLQSRQQIFQLSYGFECRCNSCLFFDKVGPIPTPPADPAQKEDLVRQLIQFKITPYNGLALATSPDPFPSELLPVFHESFITSLAETFRNASHDGEYSTAMTSGAALLALYRLIYPPNYPQIGVHSPGRRWILPDARFLAGMHLLELAKTAWNSTVSEDNNASIETATQHLNEAKVVLGIFGSEGDADGPLVEISTLDTLLTVI